VGSTFAPEISSGTFGSRFGSWQVLAAVLHRDGCARDQIPPRIIFRHRCHAIEVSVIMTWLIVMPELAIGTFF
jgi:hypothetical protein